MSLYDIVNLRQKTKHKGVHTFYDYTTESIKNIYEV